MYIHKIIYIYKITLVETMFILIENTFILVENMFILVGNA